MPAPLRPMKAANAERLPGPDGWSFEVKWDGMRVLAEVDDVGEVRAWSANGVDAAGRFPELQALGVDLAAFAPLLLDGEVVALDPSTGRPDFGRLQPRMQATSADAVRRAASEVPVTYVVFDVLTLQGHSLLTQPHERRRRLLESVVEPAEGRLVASTHADGADLLAAVEGQGLEGVVAKRSDSSYEPGRRSTAWVKVKVRREQELVVGGWLPGTGARARTFGALLVGYHEPPAGDAAPGPLRYAGRVGTGFTDAELERLTVRLAELSVAGCPFAPPPPAPVARRGRWVEPRLVVQVAHAEWTADGVLRHPSYLGERLDAVAEEVGRAP